MITDIRYDEDGFLHGKLLGCIEIQGTDLPGLKVAAKDAFEAYCLAVEKEGKTLKEELLDTIDFLYSRH